MTRADRQIERQLMNLRSDVREKFIRLAYFLTGRDMTPTSMNIGVRCGLIDRKHYLQMGDAIWLYLWFVARQTKQRHGEGLVLGGSPLTYSRISEETGFPERTIEKWTARLKSTGYVSVKYSSFKKLVIRVLKAKKFTDHQFFLIPPAGGILPASGGDSRKDRNIDRHKNIKTRDASRPAPSIPVLTRTQRRYSDTGKLIAEAEMILRNNPEPSYADLAEQIKCIAARKNMLYDGDMVAKAINIAEKRARGEGAA